MRDSMYYFCTYFDQHYLDKGLALYHSLTTHCLPFQLWILCMDEVTLRILTDMQLPQVHLIPLSDFEKDDPLLLLAKKNRSVIEYYFTCTPSLPLYIFCHAPDVDIITYLDADIYFFSAIDPIYQDLENGSILIIGHRFPYMQKEQEIHGIYNVGLLSFRRDDDGLRCLQWWRERCLEWCYDRVENNRYADQKYLDDWPHRFNGVIVSEHKGAGLAPWNLANYSYSWENKKFLIDGQPIIMYHFAGVKQINRWIYDTNIITYKIRLPEIIKKFIYIPYLKDLNHINKYIYKYLLNDVKRKESIRGFDETQISLKIKILNIYTGYRNNDLIFNML